MVNYNRDYSLFGIRDCSLFAIRVFQSPDTLRVEPSKGKAWTKAEVERQADIRSYEVRTEDGRVFRRNRRQLRLSKESLKTQGWVSGKPE